MAQSTSDTTTLPLTPLDQTPRAPCRHLIIAEQPQYIWLLTGPAGCGKSTLGKYLAITMKIPYIEGDEFHSKVNIDKMARGNPLTDSDRWDWLVSLREASLDYLAAGHQGVIVSCSALKRKYRDVIRVAPYFSHKQLVLHFFYLEVPEDLLLSRVLARKNHYMGADMVYSQLTILEPPGKSEIDVSRVDMSLSIEKIREEVMSEIYKVIQEVERKIS